MHQDLRTGLLGERLSTALSACAQAVLNELAPELNTASQVSEALSAVIAAVQTACTDFAESWNDKNTSSLMQRLPVELVSACLYSADLQTRIRASHVSRAWRKLALSERRLWADFCCTSFATYKDQLVTCDLLKSMIRRSHPLPLRVRLPHFAFGEYEGYELRIAKAMVPEMHRLVEYDGPSFVFYAPNPTENPLPALTSLICLNHENPGPLRGSIYSITPELDGVRLPNLRHLVGPTLIFSDDCSPYNSLRELVCTLPANNESLHLFRYCPNLATAEFRGVSDDVLLPLPPFPNPLRRVILHGEPDGDAGPGNGVDFEPLQAWSGEVIPHLAVFNAASLHHAATQFVAQCGDLIYLRISSQSPQVTIATMDGGLRCEISMCQLWESHPQFADDLTLLSGRLAHISVSIDHLYELRLHAPHLVSLELSLHGTVNARALATGAIIRAPGLRALTLDIGGSAEAVRAHAAFTNTALARLRSNFRALLAYDADLLESVTVLCAADAAADIRCADFAQLAKRFVGP